MHAGAGLLLVDPKYQGLGLARKHWEILRDHALRAGNRGVFIVNSSLVAVPIYQRFGFVVEGCEGGEGWGSVCADEAGAHIG